MIHVMLISQLVAHLTAQMVLIICIYYAVFHCCNCCTDGLDKLGIIMLLCLNHDYFKNNTNTR